MKDRMWQMSLCFTCGVVTFSDLQRMLTSSGTESVRLPALHLLRRGAAFWTVVATITFSRTRDIGLYIQKNHTNQMMSNQPLA